MNELMFIAVLAVMIGGIIFLVKRISNSGTGRKSNHPLYHERSVRQPSHRPATHKLVHNHSNQGLKKAEDIWRTSRAKTDEAHWQSDVMMANRIYSDSELTTEEKVPKRDDRIHSIKYSPVDSLDQAGLAGGKGGRR